MFNREELSFEQKIDYIYNDLRKKRMGLILKWIIRLFILGLIINFYFFILPTMDKDKITNKIGDEIIKIVVPIVEKTVNSIDINKIQLPIPIPIPIPKNNTINNKG